MPAFRRLANAVSRDHGFPVLLQPRPVFWAALEDSPDDAFQVAALDVVGKIGLVAVLDEQSVRTAALSPLASPMLVFANGAMANDGSDCLGGKRRRGWISSSPDVGRYALHLSFPP
jgi:hypothetical protein